MNAKTVKLTLWLQSECNRGRLLLVPFVLGLLGGDDDSLVVHLRQPLAEDVVKTEEQVPVVVGKEQRVRLILKKDRERLILGTRNASKGALLNRKKTE